MPLPHIKNSVAGVRKYDPVHTSIFEVVFTVPEAIQGKYGKDEVILTEHVLEITGLEALNKAPETGTQKFMGTDRSYMKPVLDSTRMEFSVKFTLNLRDDTDNYVYKIFRAWAALGYDVNTGSRELKRNYSAPWMALLVANRAGQVYHELILKDVMINGNIEGLTDYSYENGDAAELTVKFVSDIWDEKGIRD